MSHHSYDKEAIKRAEERIEYYKKLVDNVKGIKLGDRDSINFILDTIKKMKDVAQENVSEFLRRSTDQSDGWARYNLGLKEGYDQVIELIEKPDEFIASHQQDILADEQFLKEAKLAQKVESGE